MEKEKEKAAPAGRERPGVERLVVRNAQGRYNPLSGVLEIDFEGAPAHGCGVGAHLFRSVWAAVLYVALAGLVVWMYAEFFGIRFDESSLVQGTLLSGAVFVMMLLAFVMSSYILAGVLHVLVVWMLLTLGLAILAHSPDFPAAGAYMKETVDAGLSWGSWIMGLVAADGTAVPTMLAAALVPTFGLFVSSCAMLGTSFRTTARERRNASLVVCAGVAVAVAVALMAAQMHGVDLRSLIFGGDIAARPQYDADERTASALRDFDAFLAKEIVPAPAVPASDDGAEAMKSGTCSRYVALPNGKSYVTEEAFATPDGVMELMDVPEHGCVSFDAGRRVWRLTRDERIWEAEVGADGVAGTWIEVPDGRDK